MEKHDYRDSKHDYRDQYISFIYWYSLDKSTWKMGSLAWRN